LDVGVPRNPTSLPHPALAPGRHINAACGIDADLLPEPLGCRIEMLENAAIQAAILSGIPREGFVRQFEHRTVIGEDGS